MSLNERTLGEVFSLVPPGMIVSPRRNYRGSAKKDENLEESTENRGKEESPRNEWRSTGEYLSLFSL